MDNNKFDLYFSIFSLVVSILILIPTYNSYKTLKNFESDKNISQITKEISSEENTTFKNLNIKDSLSVDLKINTDNNKLKIISE